MLEDRDGLLNFMEALASAKDAASRTEMQPAEVRTIVIDYLSTPGTSMVDVEDDLGFTLEEALDALCNGRPSIVRTFTELRWIEIESLLEEHPTAKSWTFAKLAGLSRSSAKAILKYYGRIAIEREDAAAA